MFIISLTYKVELAKVDLFLQEHIEYLEQQYALGNFLLSGPKEPRDGGVIIANVANRQLLDEIIQADPFYREQLADFAITQIMPTKSVKELAFLLCY